MAQVKRISVRGLIAHSDSDHYLIDIASSLKIGFQASFDSACLHFTPFLRFAFPLLSCHCHRQELFRAFDMVAEQSHRFWGLSHLLRPSVPSCQVTTTQRRRRPTNQITSSSGEEGEESLELKASGRAGHQDVQQ